MIIDRASILAYWLSEPKRSYQDGYIVIGEVPFPDLSECSLAERAALKPIIARHPEYLLEISCDRRTQ